MNKTTDTLADGREIIYFDSDETRREHHPDKRDLPPVSTSSQMRRDPLLDEWVVMASHRQDRTHLPQAAQCPLCPSRDGRLTEVPAPDYQVVAFENRFPSLSSSAVAPPDPGTDLVPHAAGRGRCEVVCFSSDHDGSFATLTLSQARLVVDAWADRTSALSEREDVAQVFCFENRGEEIGVTLSHPHGQIYAYPFVTPRTERMLESARRHHERTGRNLFADVLAEELAAGERVITASRYWTAFVPAAARWPIEVHLYPHRQVAAISELSDAERDDFADVYLDVLRRFDALYDQQLPYIAAWHQAPVNTGRDLSYLHLQLMSTKRAPEKLKFLAGSESAMGAFVTDVLPEDVAARLRKLDIPAVEA